MTTAEPETELSPERFDAVIFDLDGVVTRTALLHARAWKRIFDDYLARRSDKAGNRHYRPFDSDEDYRRYVDGKPRYEGVESFLASRNIELPYGAPTDGPDEETVCGLGNRKNALFRELLQHEGAEVYASSIALIRRLREAGFLTAVVSSSRNCAAVLHSVGAEDLFDARVDGVDAERQDLRGKPAPDIFLEAARRLGVAPGRAVVVEDAMAGVRAARAGEFGRVIGVDRSGKAEVLRSRGADLVVEDLSALSVKAPRAFGSEQSVPSALERLDEILQRAAGRRTVIFLDYDGTLTPIVERPEQARLAPRMRRTLERLADRYTVAIISGRDLHDVRQRVGLENPFYAGSHGFDIAGPRGSGQAPPEAEAALPELDAAETELREALRAVDGVLIERKRFGVAVHYRLVEEAQVPGVKRAVEQVLERHCALRLGTGKKIRELLPDVEWNKGAAVGWLLNTLGLEGEKTFALYIGDDTTDEDAFAALREGGSGVGIAVLDRPRPTRAHYRLSTVEEVQELLEALAAAAESSHE